MPTEPNRDDPGDESVATYDAAGRQVGAVTRRRMRAAGLWHATTAVLVTSAAGDAVYVHRRTDHKDVFPGRYDCWAGGVVAAGETPAECARRELAEELGVVARPRPLFTFRYVDPPIRYHGHAYQVSWTGPIVHQAAEVAWGGWLTFDELRARLADPAWPFVPDGRMAIEQWFRRRDGGSR